MASAKDIRFDQRNVTNTAYQEAYVNGNSLIIRTDSTGSVVGVSSLEGVAIGLTSPSTANFTSVTATSVSSSTIIGNLSGSLSGSNITVNTITSSTGTFDNLTVNGFISASGRISASNINVGTPSPSYPWGNSMTGSYFSAWTSDTNVSDA